MGLRGDIERPNQIYGFVPLVGSHEVSGCEIAQDTGVAGILGRRCLESFHGHRGGLPAPGADHQIGDPSGVKLLPVRHTAGPALKPGRDLCDL